ncbi:HupE/UreJ family protein [Nisaea acidiphila]|uniref:HupE/UreJ family protein n=1 Tax=Nisaea acidiphila TaxID=1862145 RepID=A0A9J7AQL4_9PROT|nr:HupE/UreJ family protein [Nisaea acidiphila]UUX49688.1 HupE/UreJ family protein [Nisaea acidiphila]
MLRAIALGAAILLAGTSTSFAHLNPVAHGSFAAGLSHPLFGADHILAMIAVGIWAFQIGGRALVGVPAAFVGCMALGFVLALSGVALPFVEPAILASVVALGLLVAAAVRLPAGVCAAVVGLFALFHGHAHGGEIGAATALTYGAGFVAATALLHVAGLGAGLGLQKLFAERGTLALAVTRGVGGLTAAIGVGMLMA